MSTIKEDFCPACIAAPLAFVGLGAAAVGSNEKEKHKNRKKMLLWGGIGTVVISILVAVYFLWYKKCSDCR